MKKDVERTASLSTSGRWGAIATAVITVVALVGLIWALTHPVQPDGATLPPIADPSATARTVPESGATASSKPAGRRVMSKCRQQASKPFRPLTVELVGIGRYKAVGLDLVRTEKGPILPVPSDDNPGIFAWVTSDRAAKDRDMLRLTAHTWNDGEALGDIINERVPVGAIIIMHGSTSSQKACYRVGDRQKVTVAKDATPKQKAKASAVLQRYNGINAADDLGIMVCSNRIAPGEYRDRTNLFATRYGA